MAVGLLFTLVQCVPLQYGCMFICLLPNKRIHCEKISFIFSDDKVK